MEADKGYATACKHHRQDVCKGGSGDWQQQGEGAGLTAQGSMLKQMPS